jgi:phosphatidylinositol alpha-1,6-mannosyltransferase
MDRRVLVVTTDAGVGEDGTYRPGGLQLFSRLVVRALAESTRISHLGVVSLLDSQRAMDGTLQALLGPAKAPQMQLSMFGCGGSRARLGLTYLQQRWRYDLALFLHINVARLAMLTPMSPLSLWLVGIEVRRRLAPHERFVVRRADPLLSISDFSTKEMVRFNPGLADADAHTVHLSVEPDEPWLHSHGGNGNGVARQPTYHAAKRDRAVLVVARLAVANRYKGHDQLVDAWPRVVAKQPDAELWIVGEGDDANRLRERVSVLPEPARHRVHLLGRLDHAALLDRYARARVFAMPSTGEGFGLVFVEAMRAGLPCIASLDSAAEIVRDNETGFVVEQESEALADACLKLLRDDDLADRFSAAGRTRYETQFTYPAFRDRFLQSVNLA